MEQKLILSVKKALDVLDLLAFEDIHHKGISLSELSNKTGIKSNTLRTILKTMIACGYVEQNRSSRYFIGKRCRQIGVLNRFHMTPAIGRKLQIGMERLCRETGESVSFYVLDKGDRINYANIQSNQVIKIDHSMLVQNSIYEYPSGQILVAYCSEQEREIILKRNGYPNEHWSNISSDAELMKSIEQIRAKQYVSKLTECGEVAAYASPVFDEEDRLLGSIGVYMPSFRLTPEKEQMIIEKLKLCYSINKEMFSL